ncbi:MAG: sugar transferase [Deltaproteobacteria bacterium]|nr:sugar transferase [Deltaproteobacteria bacterium]MBW2152221.1 sugar transferase [Deltaproteobacteria bacterium]
MKNYLLTFDKKRQYVLLVGDFLIIVSSVIVSYIVKDYINREPHMFYMMKLRFDMRLVLIPMTHLFSLYILNQYNLNQITNPSRSTAMVFLSVSLSSLIISGMFFFFPKYIFGRQVLIIHVFVLSLLLPTWRLIFIDRLLKRAKARRTAVIGSCRIISSLIEEMEKNPTNIFKVHEVCILESEPSGSYSMPNRIIKYNTILDLLRNNYFDVLAFDSLCDDLNDREIRAILEMKYRGKAIYDISELYENITAKVPLTCINGRWLLNREGFRGEINQTYMKIKRLFDVILSCLVFVLSLPLFLLSIILIKIESKGPVFFIQERLGIHRKPFKCIKFRTMVENAESCYGPVWSSKEDPRITKVGRVLRKIRLDELPQLWNILKGEMSFVGPRPIREHFAKTLEEKIPFYGLRFSIKPGLSGWAQVQHNYAGSEEGQLEKFQYELFYIQNMSPFLDLLIIFKTIHKVLRGGGGV